MITKKIRIVYWTLFALGILMFLYEVIGVIIQWHRNPVHGAFVFYIIMLIIYISFINIIFKIISKINIHFTKKLVNKLTNFLFEECDPLKFIENVRKLNITDTNINTAIKLELCLAYMEINQSEKAKSILDSVSNFPNNKCGLLNKKIYYSNLFRYYLLFTNDLEKTEAVFDEMMNFIKNCYLYKNDKLEYETKYKAYFYKLELKKGNYDGMEQYYTNQFETAEYMLNKVNIKFTLGKIYMHNHKAQEAKDAFEYVILHGNKLHAVQEAKQYLEQLS